MKVSDNLVKQYCKEVVKKTWKIKIYLRQFKEEKYAKNLISLHQDCYPKDASRCTLKIAYREAFRSVFRDLLGIEKAMLAFYKPKSLKDLVTWSKMKAYKDPNTQASIYVAKQKGKVAKIMMKDRVHDLVSDDGVVEGM